MENNSSRNTLIFFVCAAVILVVYQLLVLGPANKKHLAELRAAQAVASSLGLAHMRADVHFVVDFQRLDRHRRRHNRGGNGERRMHYGFGRRLRR